MSETKNVPAVIQAVESRMAVIGTALPASLPPGKFSHTFKLAVMRSPDLMRADPRIVVEEVSKAAADGLMLDGREAALVMYKGKPKYVPMYQGLIKRAYASGYIAGIDCNIVYQREVDDGRFSYRAGTEGVIIHEPLLDIEAGEPKVGCYAVFKLKTGGQSVVFMRRAEIERIKGRSASAGSSYSPWKSDEDEMWKKTVLRRGIKLLPADADLARVFGAVDDLYVDEIKGRGRAAEILGDELVDDRGDALEPDRVGRYS